MEWDIYSVTCLILPNNWDTQGEHYSRELDNSVNSVSLFVGHHKDEFSLIPLNNRQVLTGECSEWDVTSDDRIESFR